MITTAAQESKPKDENSYRKVQNVVTDSSDGYYSIERKNGVAVGMNRVEISGSQKTGEPQPLPPVEQRRRRLTTEDIYRSWGVRPLEFESDVEMEVEIEAGRNEFDFPLRAISAE